MAEARRDLRLRKSLYEFTKQASAPHRGEPFIDNWHIQAYCEHLEAIIIDDILQLLMQCPPRSSKQFVLSVMLPAWVWLRNASERVHVYPVMALII